MPSPKGSTRDRWKGTALGATAVAAGLLPVAAATAAHAASYPVPFQRVITVAALFGVLSWAVYAAACRLARSRTRGAATAMVWSLLMFVYPFTAWLRQAAPVNASEETIGFLYLGLAATVSVFVLRSHKPADALNAVLSTIVAVMLAFSIAGTSVPNYLRPVPFDVPFAPLEGASAAGVEAPPNIYHLVLDGLGRSDVLEARYDLDLSEAVAALNDLGYIVEANARANYAQTYLSIASMLNGDYIDVPVAHVAEHSRRPLHEAIQNNRVFSTLRRSGYEVVFLASDYSATSEARLASTCRCPPSFFGEFESSVLYRTPLRGWLPGSLDHRPHRNRIDDVLEHFSRPAPHNPGAARYTFAHILSPHPPFILDEDGTFSPPRRAFTFFDGSMYPGQAAEYSVGYARQARYLLKRAVAIAAALRSQDPGAVVIISGDHGPRLRFHAADARRTDAHEVFPVFLAIRWGDRAEAAPPIASLVNLYREILRRYLGMRMPPLPDRSYVSTFARPYDLIEVDGSVLTRQ